MASPGDTITYTYTDGTSVAEGISQIDEIEIDYIRGAGSATNGGLVQNAIVDVTNYDTIYIWVAGTPDGRYNGATYSGNVAGGSSEISFQDTNSSDSDNEPFIAGAGGGYGLYAGRYYIGGARGGDSEFGAAGEGTPPPNGGGRKLVADGAVANIPEIIDPGTTTQNGGNSGNGEIQITYTGGPSPPDAPTNLLASTEEPLDTS